MKETNRRGGWLAVVLCASWIAIGFCGTASCAAPIAGDDMSETDLLLFFRTATDAPRRSPAPDSVSLEEAPTAESAPIPPELFGMHMLHLHDGTETAPDWPAIPIGSARINVDSGMSWYYALESAPGKFNWTMLDAWLDDAYRHGADLVYTFGNTPPWASRLGTEESCDGSGHANCPPRLEAWDAFIRAIVEHNRDHVNPDGSRGGKIRYWELWNEPNEGTFSGNHGFWYDPNDVKTLVEMAEHLYREVKSIDPSAQILTPAYTSSGRGRSPAAQLAQYLNAGGGKYADIISFHGYYRDLPEEIFPYVAQIRASMAANGVADKPLWDTEASWGWDKELSNPDGQQAFVARAYAIRYSLGVTRLYWYAWDGSAGQDRPGWGTLWDKTNGIHGAGRAYRETYRWLVGARMTRRCAPQQGTIWTCELRRPGGYHALMAWDAAGTKSSYQPAEEYVRYRTLDGGAVPRIGPTIELGAKPILLESGPAK